MKKLFEILMAGILAVSLAACGSSAGGKTEEPAAESSQEETVTETTEEPAETTEEPEEEAEKTDEELIAETLEALIGEWYCPAVDLEHLFFNEDGTGHYTGIDKDHAFTYTTGITRLEYPNNGRYTEDLMTINWDNGETEEVIFLIGDQGISGYPGQTKMLFQTMDHGGYFGIMNNFDVWVKKDQ